MVRGPEFVRGPAEFARCGVCGGQIYRWTRSTPWWFHETVTVDDAPFDILDWWGHPEKQHRGVPGE